MIYKMDGATVVQVWRDGKTRAQIQAQLPNADIREGSAVAGQIEVNGQLEDPPPTPPTPPTPEEVAQQAAHDALLDAITDPEVKAYLQAYPRG